MTQTTPAGPMDALYVPSRAACIGRALASALGEKAAVGYADQPAGAWLDGGSRRMPLAALTADDELLVVSRHLGHAHRVFLWSMKIKHRLDDRELVGHKLEWSKLPCVIFYSIPQASQQAVDDALARGGQAHALRVLSLSTRCSLNREHFPSERALHHLTNAHPWHHR